MSLPDPSFPRPGGKAPFDPGPVGAVYMGYFFGLVMVGLGAYAYLDGSYRVRASMMPGVFGVAILLLSSAAQNESRRRTMLLLMLLTDLFALAMAFMALWRDAPALLEGELEHPKTFYASCGLAVAAFLFLVMLVKSFFFGRRHGKNALWFAD
ncbi:MAG: hypothetical protein KBF88_10390 [Polyangiaceae bacterium]|nr:hypothetical protein [Polyangiaceae bacterium]